MLQAEAAACAKAQRQKKQSTLGNLAKKHGLEYREQKGAEL